MEVVSADDVIRIARASLGLPIEAVDLSDSYLASGLRRLAGFMCPCSPRTLHHAMIESHRGLVANEETFSERVDAALEALIAAGDLLELGDVALEGDDVRSTWLVAAPPAFVVRESGSVFILGLSADEQTPLPTEIRSRVALDRPLRSIDPIPDENLPALLRDFGFRELSNSTWLRSPKPLAASALLSGYDARLETQSSSDEISDLLVLDGGRQTRSYKRRWTAPGTLTGKFVIQRPQTYGADLWGYARIVNGTPVKLLNLPGPGDRWRGCDTAWRIQMAIDASTGRPQEYRSVAVGGGSRFDFFSPIPLWARRRLAVIGHEAEAANCLMSFFIPAREAETEKRFLSELIFLTQTSE